MLGTLWDPQQVFFFSTCIPLPFFFFSATYATKNELSRVDLTSLFSILKEAIAWVIFFIGVVLFVVENYELIYEVGKSSGSSSNSSEPVCYQLSYYKNWSNSSGWECSFN